MVGPFWGSHEQWWGDPVVEEGLSQELFPPAQFRYLPHPWCAGVGGNKKGCVLVSTRQGVLVNAPGRASE